MLEPPPAEARGGSRDELLAQAADEGEARLRHFQLPVQLVGAEADVHRHDHSAGAQAGQEREHPFGAVLRHQCHPLAGGRASVVEPPGEVVDGGCQLPVAERVVAVAQRHPGRRRVRPGVEGGGKGGGFGQSNYRPLG